jgi:hypothetical protein
MRKRKENTRETGEDAKWERNARSIRRSIRRSVRSERSSDLKGSRKNPTTRKNHPKTYNPLN